MLLAAPKNVPLVQMHMLNMGHILCFALYVNYLVYSSQQPSAIGIVLCIFEETETKKNNLPKVK